MDPDYFDFDGKHMPFLSHVPFSIVKLDKKEPLDKARLKELLYEEIASFVPSL
jgi:hypothetical protein